MEDRFKFRIPMFTDKGHFEGFQYIELGEQIESTLCGHNGKPQQCTGLKDSTGKVVFEGDIVKALLTTGRINAPAYPEKMLPNAVVDWTDFGTYCLRVNYEELELLRAKYPHDNSYYDKYEGDSFAHVATEVKIIGNIYEHSHLLEGGSE